MTTIWSLQDPHTEGWNELRKTRSYFQNSDPQRIWASHGQSLLKLKPESRILDFGSGPGNMTASLSFSVRQGEILGCDISPAMVEFARRKYPKSLYPNLAFAQSKTPDFSDCPYDEHFDIAVSFCVFHMVADPESILRHLKRALRTNGELLLVYPVFSPILLQVISATMRDFSLPFQATRKSQPSMRHEADARRFIANAGLHLDFFEHVKSRYEFYDEDELSDWAKGTVLANLNIPSEYESAFVAQFIRNYRNSDTLSRSEAGGFSFAGEYFIILARKE